MDISQAEVLNKIQTVQAYIKEHQPELPGRVYEAMDGLSRTALAYLDSKGVQGWASKVTNANDENIWTPEQAQLLENSMPQMAQTVQRGGAVLKFTPQSDLITQVPDTPLPSLDDIAGQIKTFLETIDAKNRELAKLVGPVAIVNGMTTDPSFGPFLPYLPVPIKIPARLLLPAMNAVLESCRLLVSNSFLDIGILRQLLSVVLAIFDISRGEWKDGVLSFMGVFGRDYMIMGLVGKTARWVYNFISPDLQDRLESDIFKSAKSAIIGSWLWILSVASPDFVRAQINELIDTAKKPVEELNKSLIELEKQGQISAKAIGAQVKFPRLPMERFPSFDDIQNFQSILHQPEFVCLPAFQQQIQQALTIPALRIILELLNIPTTPLGTAEFCKGQPPNPIEAVTKRLTPTVVMNPATSLATNAIKGGRRTVKKEKKGSRSQFRSLIRLF